MENKISFLAVAPDSWGRALSSVGVEAKFRAEQVRAWIYQHGVFDLESMTNLSKDLRDKLSQSLDWSLPTILERLDAPDGSSKLLLESRKGHRIESVILRYEDRVSLCVSSQVGCKLACSFCQTGKLGFVRHLSLEEILGQYALAATIVKAEGRRLSHVVFMGMGEPLDNYDASVTAANVLIDPRGFGLSARHVTLSTSGIVPKILSLAEDSRAALAVSLHASRDELRDELMPINRKYPLSELKNALKHYQLKTGKKITIEYILISGKNCSQREAKELVAFIHGLRAKVNLIPFNAHPGLPYERPTADEIRTFQKYLADRSIPSPVRYSRGLEVSAACGQLAAKTTEGLGEIPKRNSLLALAQ